MTKREAQVKHARKRAAQRFGVRLTKKVAAALVRDVQEQRATFIRSESNRITVWLVKLPDGAPAHAVYDKNRKTIVTLMEAPNA